MRHAELAALLVNASNAEREALLRENSALADVQLAYALKELCQAAWRTEPTGSIHAADSLRLLANQNREPEIEALAQWTAGIAALVAGRMEAAVESLNAADATFRSLTKEYQTAEVQLAKSVALSMLGRYEDAIDCSMRALKVFLAHGDLLAAGKIEHNIGNLYFRRDLYHEADKFQSAARERFITLNDQKQLASVNNCLANTRALLHEFKSAEKLYEEAMHQAEDSGVAVTQAEIESNIGMFALLQGRYDRALDYLERSRRRYTSLGMPHQSATAEQEIADAYLELNLVPEAATIYEKVIPQFSELGMQAEQARALAFHGRAALLLDHIAEARELLVKSRNLYAAEKNEVGEAMAALSLAQLEHQLGNFEEARSIAVKSIPPLERSGSWRKFLLARWLWGECERALNNHGSARKVLDQTLQDAEQNGQPQVAERCCTSLGLLAAANGDTNAAEEAFKRSIALIEELRSPLPGEEFRAAFFADKLLPYQELVRLCLSEGSDRKEEAFQYVEKARARALVETLGGDLTLQAEPRDAFEAEMLGRLETLRQERNYLYNQLNRPAHNQLNAAEIKLVQAELQERERQTSELMRQLQHRSAAKYKQIDSLDVRALQHDLSPDTALVEYTGIDDELLAFVITSTTVEVVRNLASEADVADELRGLRFQIDTLRHGSQNIRRHLPELSRRAQLHQGALYEQLWRPIEDRICGNRVLIVPHRVLHYLPFQALYDGDKYLIEAHEISYAPSALVLQQCLRRGGAKFSTGIFFGVGDELIPKVRDEVKSITPLFSEAVALLDGEATIEALVEHAPSADVVHLACHGQFRPDNPLFSSLRLGNGWFTVRDAYDLKLRSSLVTLSACETGVSTVAPGDELIGLARGFFAAGSPSLLISLWTVDDDATASLMVTFYEHLQRTRSCATALRAAQIQMLREKPHPFFWAPFVLMGRP